jgi:ribosomal protein L16/L10AE
MGMKLDKAEPFEERQTKLEEAMLKAQKLLDRSTRHLVRLVPKEEVPEFLSTAHPEIQPVLAEALRKEAEMDKNEEEIEQAIKELRTAKEKLARLVKEHQENCCLESCPLTNLKLE